jgi:AraC family transcriptional regulator of adaptative response / DNA-3-methyladenine glycosylase II
MVVSMRMTDAQMYARLLASDADYDGRFFTGVLTTGIYCLPSCKARKPKPGNVRFFPSAEAARAAGLRPCRKCHPDDFARGADPVLESLETLVREIREDPARFPDARAVVRRSGYGATRAFELFRRFYHTTPADLLLRARVAKAWQLLLREADSVSDTAFAAGFESLSAFHENFRWFTGLTPAGCRELRDTEKFEIALPADFSLPQLRHALSRDVESACERLDGDDYTLAATLSGKPALLRMRLTPDAIAVACPHGAAVEAHAIVARLLGLGQDVAAFDRLARKLGFAALAEAGANLRISQTPTVFEGLLWAIIGQQIHLAFACRLKRRLFELCGEPAGEGLIACPSPGAVARLEPEQLLPLQFSRQKASYLIAAARLTAEGKLNLDALPALSVPRVERLLLAMRGLGPWSVHFLMMRALGFADCMPLGDTGVTSGLQRLMHLDTRPDIDATRRLMAVFSPHRSLATAHLWQLNRQPAIP